MEKHNILIFAHFTPPPSINGDQIIYSSDDFENCLYIANGIADTLVKFIDEFMFCNQIDHIDKFSKFDQIHLGIIDINLSVTFGEDFLLDTSNFTNELLDAIYNAIEIYIIDKDIEQIGYQQSDKCENNSISITALANAYRINVSNMMHIHLANLLDTWMYNIHTKKLTSKYYITLGTDKIIVPSVSTKTRERYMTEENNPPLFERFTATEHSTPNAFILKPLGHTKTFFMFSPLGINRQKILRAIRYGDSFTIKYKLRHKYKRSQLITSNQIEFIEFIEHHRDGESVATSTIE